MNEKRINMIRGKLLHQRFGRSTLRELRDVLRHLTVTVLEFFFTAIQKLVNHAKTRTKGKAVKRSSKKPTPVAFLQRLSVRHYEIARRLARRRPPPHRSTI